MNMFSSATALSLMILMGSFSPCLLGEEAPVTIVQKDKITPFTGKITRNKVRLRQQPNLESPIVKEFANGDLVIVVDEEEDFYAIQSPSDIKGYVFRTFVLDNIVEGSKVNIRLEPDLNSPIIAQLNTGDKVNGTVSSQNSKWLEIAVPENAHFYIAKEYVDKIGDAAFLAKMEKKQKEINNLLEMTYSASQREIEKSYPNMQIEPLVLNFHNIMKEQQHFPIQAARAKELLTQLQDDYMQKKIAYLEAKSQDLAKETESQNLSTNLVSEPTIVSLETPEANGPSPSLSCKMSQWNPYEEHFYTIWASQHEGKSQEEFYQNQRKEALTLKGILEPYNRTIKNKPGDFVLVNQSTHLPLAFIYSTKVNLQQKVGQEVTLYCVPRPNNNFAYPAYFVLSVD